ncbi:acyltransferase family protein [Rhodoblastus acidophilus]|uniref:Acyltransferase family protein n=1 Tax=Candidatus Rhodoblastus alkanivorans TaxID=2954117 RepID=A0ABS9Z3K9_9HYPH|nr:acyltransferase family protein [Candidatus Rhodoblastus alkanivorans]MCI4681935.1 acyltransferase family protein [Candidatus Rhodoblastus alkanivorans]MDI4642985.1 acyltransferase family protein [Rhodoblastus acidophilus]
MFRNNGTIVRYIAAYLVIIQHAYMLAREHDPFTLFRFHWWTGQTGVLIFFAFSGYILTTRLYKDNIYDFVFHRLFRIYPLLIAVNVITVALMWCFTKVL